jgi:hypothetical protein
MSFISEEDIMQMMEGLMKANSRLAWTRTFRFPYPE